MALCLYVASTRVDDSPFVTGGQDANLTQLLSCRQSVQEKAAQHSQEHDAVVLKMAETIKSKVEEMMASEAIQQRIQLRLKEERAALEDKVLDSSCHAAIEQPGAGCTVMYDTLHVHNYEVQLGSCLVVASYFAHSQAARLHAHYCAMLSACHASNMDTQVADVMLSQHQL